MPRGRKPAAFENSIYRELDKFIPEAVAYCAELIRKAVADPKNREAARLGLDAAKILISKMPERQVGGDGGAVKYEVKWS